MKGRWPKYVPFRRFYSRHAMEPPQKPANERRSEIETQVADFIRKGGTIMNTLEVTTVTDKDYPNPPQDEQRSDYHRECGLMTAGDPTGECEFEDEAPLRDKLLAGGPMWDMDCTEYLIPHGNPEIDQKLRYNLENAIVFLMYTRQEMTNKNAYPDTKSVLLAGEALSESLKNIGMIVLDNFIKETEGK